VKERVKKKVDKRWSGTRWGRDSRRSFSSIRRRNSRPRRRRRQSRGPISIAWHLLPATADCLIPSEASKSTSL